MTQVPNEPLIRPVGRNTRRYILQEPFLVITDTLGTIIVPSGFETDFNSTPWGTWNLLPPDDYPEASVPHDYLYQKGVLNGTAITQLQSDRVHRELVIWAGAPAWKVHAYYVGLRVGGSKAWNAYRAKDAAAV